jgi:hypothetical protein
MLEEIRQRGMDYCVVPEQLIAMSRPRKTRNRKDHYVPQGYLRGFIAPSRRGRNQPLFCFSKETSEWNEVSPSEIGYEDGFYDPTFGSGLQMTADDAFAPYERGFPILRENLIQDRFAGWEDHTLFLLEYMQMMRARSPLAMSQWEMQARGMHAKTIYSSEPQPMDEAFIKNFQILNMIRDAKGGARWMTDFNWLLRYTDDENHGYCTTAQVLNLFGSLPDSTPLVNALPHPDSLLVFPLCWEACLIGTRMVGLPPLEFARPQDVLDLRQQQMRRAEQFLVSPVLF